MCVCVSAAVDAGKTAKGFQEAAGEFKDELKKGMEEEEEETKQEEDAVGGGD